jgi:pimeloyl-ACP methyl ester carboxylesterase
VARHGKRALLGLGALIVALAALGAVYQATAAAADARAYPPPGELVAVGGHRLHLYRQGAGQPGPTVVLEYGLGGVTPVWGWVQPAVAQFAPVVSYDRAGLGWSDPDDEPLDAPNVSRRLHTLLRAAGVEGPYVLVGHSLGGLLARAYADRYPEEVAGVVLVDSSHPEQAERLPALAVGMQVSRLLYELLPLAARVGLIRIAGLAEDSAAGLPPRHRAEAAAFLASVRHLEATRDEARAMPTIAAQVSRTGSLGDRPLTVLTAGAGAVEGWAELQAELAALSSRGTQRTIAGAAHLGLLTHREHAEVVAAAIHEVVEAVRSLP